MPFSSSSAAQKELLGEPERILTAALDGGMPPGGVRTVYQPIRDFDGDQVVAYEALTRGPSGSHLESPTALFDAAREAGCLTDFDRACRDAALARAKLAGVDPPLTVFVNVEPGLVEEPWSAEQQHTWVEAPRDLRCCIEITERALADRPAALLHAIAHVRAASWGVALDDVGADHRSLALMALLRPDVIKLDMRLIQQRPDSDVADVVGAVNAQAQRTGALVLAEGIENDEHQRIAMALGASLGQGYGLGRPGDLPADVDASGLPIRFLGGDFLPHGPTPFTLVREFRTTRRGDAATVAALMSHLEELARSMGPSTVVLRAHDGTPLDPSAEARLAALTERCALVGVVGSDSPWEVPYRSGMPGAGNDLEDERALVVLSPHMAAAVVARRLGGGPADEALFEYAVTHAYDLVAACGRSLAAHLAPVAPVA